MAKLIGYARVSTRQHTTDRQEADLLAAGVRRDDLYLDRGVSGARTSRPNFDKVLDALHAGDTLVMTTLDRLGRSTQNMVSFSDELKARSAGLRVLNLGEGTWTLLRRWERCCSASWPRSLKWSSRLHQSFQQARARPRL